MMSQSYDVDVDDILDSVLNNIDDMMLTQIPTYTSSSYYSSFYCAANSNINNNMDNSSNHSSSSSYIHQQNNKTSPICNVYYRTSSQTASTMSNSSISPSISKDICSTTDDVRKLIGSSIFKPVNGGKLQLKDYVYISKDSTHRLSQYLVKENWGKDNVLLYKYLDYIFRCQAFNKQIIRICHKNGTKDTKREYLIFHSGLQRKSDNHFLFVLLIPNNIPTKQDWRVNIGPIKNSFLSKNELLRKLNKDGITVFDHSDLPQRTKFFESLLDPVYDDTHSVEVNWEERLTTNKDRIYKVMGNAAFFDTDKKYLRLSELVKAFDESLQKTQRMAEGNPRLAVPQGFVDTKHNKYRMELLLPIIIQFPRYHGKYYKFALAIDKSAENEKTYVIKSILTLEMAYANARLVGYVDSLWLIHGNTRNGDTNINEFCVNL